MKKYLNKLFDKKLINSREYIEIALGYHLDNTFDET